VFQNSVSNFGGITKASITQGETMNCFEAYAITNIENSYNVVEFNPNMLIKEDH